uniref:Uncharacterized protein n=1 Tax=Magnetospirillum gryphiswaldense TaxID=55518 RepID=A4U3W6_9PROT|nr:hypothetical protein MGR_0469 [Magnetospirillum gryphiswaldense MSR-1]
MEPGPCADLRSDTFEEISTNLAGSSPSGPYASHPGRGARGWVPFQPVWGNPADNCKPAPVCKSGRGPVASLPG